MNKNYKIDPVALIKAIQSEMEKEIYFHKNGLFKDGAKGRAKNLIEMLKDVKKAYAHLLPEDDTPSEYQLCSRCGVAQGWCICFE